MDPLRFNNDHQAYSLNNSGRQSLINDYKPLQFEGVSKNEPIGSIKDAF
jgi:hypothetical protein